MMDDPTKSAKPPPPVQIRAAPPIFFKKPLLLFVPGTIARSQLVSMAVPALHASRNDRSVSRRARHLTDLAAQDRKGHRADGGTVRPRHAGRLTAAVLVQASCRLLHTEKELGVHSGDIGDCEITGPSHRTTINLRRTAGPVFAVMRCCTGGISCSCPAKMIEICIRG
jgi:hypothetical protein